jgi:protein-disulfide isomerase
VNRTIGLGAAAAGVALACAAGLFVGVNIRHASDDAAFGRRVRAYVMAHPELVAEAADKLRIAPYRKAIETPFAGASAGNPQGDVTLVMFTDYNCPYCRASAPAIERLLANDPRLRVVWREMPLLGPGSETAALAALAAARMGKYPAFHRALFSGPHPQEGGIEAAAKAAGIALPKLAEQAKAPEIQAEIATNFALARQLGIEATPYFIVGNRTFKGAVGYDRLAEAVAAARSSDR